MAYVFKFPEVSGYALDFHTEYSQYLGEDERGRRVFDTKRTEVGELLYRLKYRQDRQAGERLVGLAVKFINEEWRLSSSIDCLVAVPPSQVRAFQPVILLAGGLAKTMGKPIHSLTKIQKTPSLKGLEDQVERARVLAGVFQAYPNHFRGKTCLVVDDLIRSGSTIREVAKTLLTSGQATRVFGLAFSKTRSKR